MQRETLRIHTIAECNKHFSQVTLHPLASGIELSEVHSIPHDILFDFYAVILLENNPDAFYGRRTCDYSNASIIFVAPHTAFDLDPKMMSVKGRMLVFHSDLIKYTPLQYDIKNYTFFSYGRDEALHISQREKAKAMECLDSIKGELEHLIDYYSQPLMSGYIGLFLNHCQRFYERQFIIREEENKSYLRKFESMLDEYVVSDNVSTNIPYLTKCCAERLHMSTAYLKDLLIFETGKAVSEHFQSKRLEVSKGMLLRPDVPVNVVAEKLGYSSVQQFSRFFKLATGMAPQDYRLFYGKGVQSIS